MAARQSRSAASFWNVVRFLAYASGVWGVHKILDWLWEAYGAALRVRRVVPAPVVEWVSRTLADHSQVIWPILYVLVPAAIVYYFHVRRRAGTGHDGETEDTCLAGELRRERERERRERDIRDLETLLESGRPLLARLEREPERPRPSGSIGLASPVLPVTYRGFEMDEWSGLVVQKLKGMEPRELESYFVECNRLPEPLERGRCYVSHLEGIIGRFRRRRRRGFIAFLRR